MASSRNASPQLFQSQHTVCFKDFESIGNIQIALPYPYPSPSPSPFCSVFFCALRNPKKLLAIPRITGYNSHVEHSAPLEAPLCFSVLASLHFPFSLSVFFVQKQNFRLSLSHLLQKRFYIIPWIHPSSLRLRYYLKCSLHISWISLLPLGREHGCRFDPLRRILVLLSPRTSQEYRSAHCLRFCRFSWTVIS